MAEDHLNFLKNGCLRPELYIGVLSSVTAQSAHFNLSGAGSPSATHFHGGRYGKGEVGEFVLIEGQVTHLLGRIVDIRLPERDRRSVNPSSGHPDHLDAVGTIQLLGSVAMDTLCVTAGVQAYPRLGDRVYSAPHHLLANLPRLVEPDNAPPARVLLKLGAIDVARECAVALKPEKLFGRHCAILGATGGGKSWTTARLIDECLKYKAKLILLDATSEYRDFRGDTVDHYHLGEPPQRAGTSQKTSLPPSSFIETDFLAMFEPAGKVQGPKLRAAIRSLRLAEKNKKLAPKGIIMKVGASKKDILEAESAANYLDDPASPFDVTKLVPQIEQECVYPDGVKSWGPPKISDPTKWGIDSGEFTHCLSLVARINAVMTSPAFACVFKDTANPLTGAIDTFVTSDKRLLRICLGGVAHEFKAREIVANVIGRKLLSLARENTFAQAPLVIIVDEAHSFLGRHIGSEDTVARLDAFELIAKEGRKYGLNICLVTQRPRDITEDVLSQMGTLIVHRLTNDKDREVVERACGEIDRAAASFLPTLKPGEAAIIGADFPHTTDDPSFTSRNTPEVGWTEISRILGGLRRLGRSMARLTEQEKADVQRYLDADKPLPDRYRFLLFDDKREVELVWNGKTNEVCNVVLPFQTIEQVDEPRIEGKSAVDDELAGGLFDARGRQMKGWTNKLIWGDNKLILSSLKNGPMRDEIEKQGGLKLIYIDPPFDVGADFSMDIEVGDGGDTFTKRPGILEEIAYRDTWGKGTDSFYSMIYERLDLMRDLLAENGSIYVNLDENVVHGVKVIMDELFAGLFQNDIIVRSTFSHADANRFGSIHQTLLFYTRSADYKHNTVYVPYEQDYTEKYYRYKDPDGRKWLSCSLTGAGASGGQFLWKGVAPPKGRHWAQKIETLDRLETEGRIYWTSNGIPRLKQYLDEMEGTPASDVWWDKDCQPLLTWTNESLGYPTQKPESLLERVIRSSSNPGDLVADFFVGSGTTAVVAERLGRKWIAADLGKFAIHTTRKRMIGAQRQLKAEGKDYRAFEVLNLGRYERQHYVGVNPNLREADKEKQLEAKESAFVELILRAYSAEKITGYPAFNGKKAGRLVVVGPVNLPVTRLFVEEIIVECRKKNITKVDILGFEFEMGLFPNVLDEARTKGIDIAPKYIPAEVFDKRAVEKNQVVFHDVSFIEVSPIVKDNAVAVKLTDFSVFYSQDSIAAAEAALADAKKGGAKIVVEKGQIVKVSKDAKGITRREVLTEKWTDWVDYWAVDFDYENKREIIRVPVDLDPDQQKRLPGMEKPQLALQAWEERWTGEYIFENEWQSFRTKKDRTLELTSAAKEVEPGRRKIAVKVVDIFGNDTMTIVDVSVGNGKKRGK